MKKVRYITDAAMVTAILAVFLLISHLSGGLIVTNFAFLLPIPITIYGLKYDCKKAIIPAIASIAISLIINWIIGLLYVIPSIIAGIMYIFALNHFKQKPGLRLGVMFIGSLFVNILTTVFFSKALFGFTIMEDTLNIANSIIDTLKNFNFFSESAGDVLRAVLISVIPATIVVSSLMECLATYLVTSIIAVRLLKIDIGAGIITFNLRVPRIVTYMFLPIALASLFFIDVIVGYQTVGFYQIIESIGLNILVLLFLAYLLEGLLIISLYASKKHMQYLAILAFVLLFVVPYLIAILGFFDSLFDLKRKIIGVKNY